MSRDDAAFVKEVRELCMRNYSAGGDVIIECFSDREIMEEFEDLDDVKTYCGLKVEAELNARWGEDDDACLKRPVWED